MKRLIAILKKLLPATLRNLLRPLFYFIYRVLRRLRNYIFITRGRKKVATVNKTRKLSITIRSTAKIDIESLKREYQEKGLDKVEDTFVLYRILGNDLHLLHKEGQTLENLQFLLDHELELKNCEKRWIVNRIMDKSKEQAIIGLLEDHMQTYIHIPFVADEYREIGWDTESLPKKAYLATMDYKELDEEFRKRAIVAVHRLKNNYVMNNNGARNTALEDGIKRAKWILPWDGNCFLTAEAWEQLRADVTSSPYMKYFCVPMARITDNAQLLSEGFKPTPDAEPQLIFRMDAKERFNESFCYGRRPKIELLWRLDVPGPWDKFKDQPWDLERLPISDEAGQFGKAGWVARMDSGAPSFASDSSKAYKERGLVRLDAIIATLRKADGIVAANTPSVHMLMNLDETKIEQEIQQFKNNINDELTQVVNRLIQDADEALTKKTYSVIDKTTLPPSGNRNDYWHPSPYWWPDPKKSDGLPYIRKDGQRVPGTVMYEPESEKYDRTRVQMMFDDSLILALAWKFTGRLEYALHGVKILERFFVNKETAMTPHMMYSHVRMGHNNNIGANDGIIELKDMYYYLDAIRIFMSAGAIPSEMLEKFKEWLSSYLQWLVYSPHGIKECCAQNNHGTYYDLQVASIAAFLDEQDILTETLIRAQTRVAKQFESDGSQPEELRRTITAHYCCFNFIGWINLSEIASKWGIDLWKHETKEGAGLVKGAKWLLDLKDIDWPYAQIDVFDQDRFLPIWHRVPDICRPSNSKARGTKYDIKPKYHPHDGIRPYWNIGGK